ncbi:hypothetical protein ACFL2H_10920 [Planctomycetota bacterium]
MNNVSVALFGSHVRNDNDALSDRDMLLVYPECQFPRRMTQALESHGNSCAVYSRKRLSSLASTGSLFIQHLVRESEIIVDPDGFLHDVLSRFELLPDYRATFDGALSIFGLLELIPYGSAGIAWAADIAAVSFRSMAIPFLADRGITAYGMHDICLALMSLSLLSKSDAERLQVLRGLKSQYRKHGRVACDPRELTAVIEIIDRCFGIGLRRQFVAPPSLVTELHLNRSTDWYRGVRLLEACLLPYRHLNCPRIASIQEIVKSPQVYGWKMKHDNAGVMATLNDVLRRFSHTTLHDRVKATVSGDPPHTTSACGSALGGSTKWSKLCPESFDA